MKKLFLLLISAMLIFLLCSCAADFAFRDHHFGDTTETIIAGEGEPDDTITDIDDWESLVYPNVEIWDGYDARLVYSFNNNGLKHIIAAGNFGYRVDVADAAGKLKAKVKLGNPSAETDETSVYKVLWKKDGYAAALVITADSFTLVYGEDIDRVEAFYDSQMLTDLYLTDPGAERSGT